ncbi:MAG: FTR1 family protein, partial [Bacteriovoracales bacterium]
HGGWIFSIILGIVSYIILDKTFSISGAHIEKMEGFVSLLAAGILLYVGVWFQRQSHMKKWINLINKKVSTSIGGGNLIGLASISFLVVFREVFETMLFVKILLLQYNALFLVLSGILLAIIITLIIGMAFLKVSAKIPLKPFFNISSILILVLVLMLISKGILAFQKTGIISSTQILNSSLEVIIPQLLVLGIGIYTLFFNKKN